jgi:hypothetical protein
MFSMKDTRAMKLIAPFLILALAACSKAEQGSTTSVTPGAAAASQKRVDPLKNLSKELMIFSDWPGESKPLSEVNEQIVVVKKGTSSIQKWKIVSTDESGYYRIKSADGRCIDQHPDSKQPRLSECGEYSGQYWKIDLLLNNGAFSLRTMYTGDNLCLGVIHDEKDTDLRMFNCADYTAQSWHFLMDVPVKTPTPRATPAPRATPPAPRTLERGDNPGNIGIKLTAAQLTAVKNLLDGRTKTYPHTRAHPVEHCVLAPDSSDPSVVELSKSNHNKLTKDGENALLTAAMFSHTKDANYAKHSANILLAWARTNRSFSGKNGFLASAWGVGAMARAARILKENNSSEWSRIEPTFVPWVVGVAETYWLPRDPARPLPDTKPQLLSKWEMENISNRTFTALEATLHVAYLIEDKSWFAGGVKMYQEILPKFVLTDSGMNADDYRGDPWHRQAGIASAVQICELAKRYGYDLYGIHNNALRSVAEYYAPQVNNQFIPFWRTAVDAYGAANVPQSAALLKRDKGSYYKWYIDGVEFLWGLGQFL